MSEHQEHGAVVAVRTEHSAIGHHHEELLADGKVIAWTEPPFGETPGEDDPDHNPICWCPRAPRAFCMECAGCADCEQCRCSRPVLFVISPCAISQASQVPGRNL